MVLYRVYTELEVKYNMLKISKLADYAIHIMHVLSVKECMSAVKIAELTLISEPTVSKILKKLAAANLLLSHQGSKGGYQLSKTAEKISLAELIIAMDGKPAMTECCKEVYDCARERVCGQKNNWRSINHMVFSMLDKISLRDMKDRQL